MWARARVVIYALYFLMIQVKLINSRTSWRLNADKVVKGSETISSSEDEDPIFDILASTINLGNGQGWSKTDSKDSNQKLDIFCNDCKNFIAASYDRRLSSFDLMEPPNVTESFSSSPQTSASTEKFNCNLVQRCDEPILDCGKPVNFTYYDNLVGVINRNKHPLVPEPNVALMFRKRGAKVTDIDIDLLEKRLKRAKREKPKSVQLYNQIGNFWRIKGNAQRSIECFRRALAVSPHNAEVLLNLARVLLALQYLDDATYLARRSLELQPPDRNAWEQYLTLGQIFKSVVNCINYKFTDFQTICPEDMLKEVILRALQCPMRGRITAERIAYGHFQEAAVHLRHALELKPDLMDAAEALKEVESLPAASVHAYTLLIIVCLVLGVLLVVLSSVECDDDSSLVSEQPQRSARHFNRALAMRSLRLGVSRNKRCG